MSEITDIKETLTSLEGSIRVPVLLQDMVDEDGLLSSTIIDYLGIRDKADVILRVEDLVNSVLIGHVEIAYLTTVLHSTLRKDFKYGKDSKGQTQYSKE